MASAKDIRLYQGEASQKDIVLRALESPDSVAVTAIYLRAGEASPKDIVLHDPAAAPSVGGGQTVAPGACAVVISGYAPAIAQSRNIAPASGNVIVQGFAPAVHLAITVAPSAGAVSVAGYAPSIQQPRTVAPAAGAISVAGYAPSISQATSISPPTGALVVTGYAPTISTGGGADTRLDDILSILMGRKVYDTTTKLWRVYDADGNELADPSGILLRGLHGWLLQQANGQGEIREVEVDFAAGRKRKNSRYQAESLAEQITDVEAEKARITDEKRRVNYAKKRAKPGSQKRYELVAYEYLLSSEILKVDSDLAYLRAQEDGDRVLLARLAWQQQVAAMKERQAAEQAAIDLRNQELDIAYVLMILAEAA